MLSELIFLEAFTTYLAKLDYVECCKARAGNCWFCLYHNVTGTPLRAFYHTLQGEGVLANVAKVEPSK